MTTTNTYDALNRLTLAQFAGLNPVTRSYVYDSCTNGAGRLCQMTDPAGVTSWAYGVHGRVTGKTQMTGAVPHTYQVVYGYNSVGQLTSVTYPSGAVVTYAYNGNNQISSVSVTADGSTQTILSGATYDPFGPIKGWTWGNGTVVTRSTDADGRQTSINTGALSLTYQYDDSSRITGITNLLDGALSWTYGYDNLDRLNSATKTGTTIGFTYDANGNRLTQTGTAAYSPHTYVYDQPRTSNKLLRVEGVASGPSGPYTVQPRNFSLDARGNASPTGITYLYDASNRFFNRGDSFWVNGLEQRTRRQWAGAERHSVFDESGRLLGQYDSLDAYLPPAYNNFPTETVWLGDLPVAVLYRTPVFEDDPSEGSYVAGISAAKLLYLHADHLGTPRRLTKPADNSIAWRWDSDAFGNGTATGEIEYTMRFPGQIHDFDQGITENWHREYDPFVGRYVQSDPVGLAGGMSTYAYVGGNPLWYSDIRGLATDVLNPPWRPSARPIPWGRILGQAGKAAGRFVPGVGWVILAYEVCSVVDDYLEKKKCQEVEDECFEECKHLLAGDRLNQGNPRESPGRSLVTLHSSPCAISVVREATKRPGQTSKRTSS